MKKIAVLLVALLVLTFTCTAMAESVSIAIVYSDTVDDKGWCQSMDNGVKKAIEMGYEIDYTPVESVAIPDAPNTIDQYYSSLVNYHSSGKEPSCRKK